LYFIVCRGKSDTDDELDAMFTSTHTVLIQERMRQLMESNRSEKCPNCEIGLPKFITEKDPMYVSCVVYYTRLRTLGGLAIEMGGK